VTFGVVVEVDMNVEAAREPAPRVIGPRTQAALAVARRVLARVAVQAHVDEVGGDRVPERKVGRIGDARSDVAAREHARDVVGEPRAMAQLQRVARGPQLCERGAE